MRKFCLLWLQFDMFEKDIELNDIWRFICLKAQEWFWQFNYLNYLSGNNQIVVYEKQSFDK